MGFLRDFKDFAVKGNVMDLAIGVVIGGAFGKIVTSVVDDLIMPVISLISGGNKFTDHMIVLKAGKDGASSYPTLEAAKAAGANVLAYGHLIQMILDFLIIAFAIFLMVRYIIHRRKKDAETPAAPPAPTTTEVLLTEIRDSLRNNANRP